jgi:hypothetical protein
MQGIVSIYMGKAPDSTCLTSLQAVQSPFSQSKHQTLSKQNLDNQYIFFSSAWLLRKTKENENK